jgi:hypothetical protein
MCCSCNIAQDLTCIRHAHCGPPKGINRMLWQKERDITAPPAVLLQLYKLAQEGFRPAKYFSIDRVFRNEAIDRTHLAEFHQVCKRMRTLPGCYSCLHSSCPCCIDALGVHYASQQGEGVTCSHACTGGGAGV